MKLLSIINDTDIQRGIIVSRNGFTRDAQMFAEHHNIKIVQLRESENNDNEQKEVEFGILDLFFKINVSRPEVTRIVVKTNDDNEIILPETQQYLVYIENKDGTKIRLYDSVMVFKKSTHSKTF
jgi:hypothetical protein